MKFTNCFRIGVGLLAVMLLVLGGCGGDSNSDIIAPSLTILPVTPVTTTMASRTLSGTVEAGASVVVTVGTTEFPATVTDTSWTCSIDLAPGANAIAVRAEDATGNSNTLSFALTYDAVSIEVYTTPIPVGSVTVGGLVDGTNYTSPLQVTVTPADTAVAPFTVDASVGNNTWSADLTGLANGANAIKVSNVIAGVTDPVERTVTINVDADAPPVSFDPAFSFNTTSMSFPTFVIPSQTVTGTTVAGATVTTLPLSVGTVSVDSVGGWSASILGLPVGKNQVSATATVNGKSATARTLLFIDQTPPLVTSVSPAANAISVALDAVVSVVFPADMDATSIDKSSFTLSAGGNLVSASPVYDPTTRTATLTPDAPLSIGTTYTVGLTTAVTDADHNPLNQTLSWDFTTVQ